MLKRKSKSKFTWKGFFTVLGGFISHLVSYHFQLIIPIAFGMHIHLGKYLNLCCFLLQ